VYIHIYANRDRYLRLGGRAQESPGGRLRCARTNPSQEITIRGFGRALSGIQGKADRNRGKRADSSVKGHLRCGQFPAGGSTGSIIERTKGAIYGNDLRQRKCLIKETS